MPTKTQKQDTVSGLKGAFDKAQLAVVADYRGLSVAEITDLRRRVQAAGGELTVAKNTLLKVVTGGSEQWSGLESLLKGPTAVVFGNDDYIGAAKALNDFAKEKRAVKVAVRGGVLNGEILTLEKFNAIANLPSRDALLSMLLQCMQGPASGLVRVLDAIAKQKGEGAEAPAAAAAPAAEAAPETAEAPVAEAAPETAEAPAAEAPEAAPEA